MFCYIYRSSKQDEMYLYLREKDQFADVPVELAKRFGTDDSSAFVNGILDKVKYSLGRGDE